MYWDVVSVKPEPDYCLFVHFADGTQGRVCLSPDEFTGALTPLRDRAFFERVFVDQGRSRGRETSTWPPTQCTSR